MCGGSNSAAVGRRLRPLRRRGSPVGCRGLGAEARNTARERLTGCHMHCCAASTVSSALHARTHAGAGAAAANMRRLSAGRSPAPGGERRQGRAVALQRS
jgi:hypothetical protein